MSPLITPGGSSSSSGDVVLFSSTLGADAASIDTGAAGIAAGQRLMEVLFYVRTDEAVPNSSLVMTLNNDVSAVYDRGQIILANAAVSGANTLATNAWTLGCAGDTAAAGVFSAGWFCFPNYAGTTGFKRAVGSLETIDTAAASVRLLEIGLGYRSTAAISRLKIAPAGGTVLRAGSQLVILGR